MQSKTDMYKQLDMFNEIELHPFTAALMDTGLSADEYNKRYNSLIIKKQRKNGSRSSKKQLERSGVSKKL